MTSAVTGSGTVSFALVPDSSDGVVFSSRQGANPPELVLVTGTPDTTAPDTTITGGPTGTVTTGDASFGLTSSETGSTFECKLDTGTWGTCTSPKAYTGLANGQHTFEVRATDTAGNTDASPATRTWTVQVPIDTTIDSGPSGTVASPDASFTFSANTTGATFECKLDTGSWAGCDSPKAHTGLADGQHTFEVRATAGGQTDATPATRTWTIDTSLPAVATVIADATVREASATTNYGTTPNLEADTSPVEHAYLKFDVTGVSGGQTVASATLRLYGTNPTSNGPRVFTTTNGWTENGLTWATKPAPTGTPVADLGSVSSGAWTEVDVTAAVTGNGTVSLALVPDSSNGVVFDSRQGTNPPQLVLVTGGPDTTPPDTSIVSGPNGTVGSTTASFGFTSSEPGSTFECKLDTGTWATCTNPKNYTGLATGPHTFSVRATDTAGNTDPSPSLRNWTIDTTQPQNVTLQASADSRIAEATPTSNFGTLTDLVADSSPLTHTLIAFDQTPVTGTVQSAVLRLYATNGTGNGPTVHEVTSAWTENAVTWNNRPTTAGAVLGNIGSAPAGAWIEVDVTAAVTGTGTVDFALIPESSDGLFLNSREAASQTPQLVVTTIP